MTKIEEIALKAYPDNKIRLQKVCYREIQRQAYSRGAKAMLEEIEVIMQKFEGYDFHNPRIVDLVRKINELKGYE